VGVQPSEAPVTLALALAQFALHYRALLVPAAAAALPAQAALRRRFGTHPARMLRGGPFELLPRLVLAPLLHADDGHIVYNMASFAIKGASLEPHFGPRAFAALLARLALAKKGLTHVALAALLARLSSARFAHKARASCSACVSAASSSVHADDACCCHGRRRSLTPSPSASRACC
jgi:membrane associated rhomboid family serine protease